jgi:hypothetical protein
MTDRIASLIKAKEEVERKAQEAFREMNSVHQNLLNQKQTNSSDETRWETEKQELFGEVQRSNVIMEEK